LIAYLKTACNEHRYPHISITSYSEGTGLTSQLTDWVQLQFAEPPPKYGRLH